MSSGPTASSGIGTIAKGRYLLVPRISVLCALLASGCTLFYGDFPGNNSPDASTDGGNMLCNAPPANLCFDQTALRVNLPLGTHTQGSCTYDHYDVLCANGCHNGACIGNDPCDGITCIHPMAPACVDGNTLRTSAMAGTCSLGVCSYTPIDTTCAQGCASGACKGDPCAGVSCNQPPVSVCLNSTIHRSFASAGTCGGGACTYASVDMSCESGCQSGACLDEPCAGIFCNDPPAASCLNATTRRSYTSPGICGGGSCSYVPTDFSCAQGCQGSTCLNDPCAGVTCNQPPAASCANATTRRTYPSMGSCNNAACSYKPTDTPCTAPTNASPLCSAGQCDFQCNSGYHRAGSSCVISSNQDGGTDGGSVEGNIACGTTTCQDICCTSDYGASGYCSNGCGEGGWACDGPEDCVPLISFCGFLFSGASCLGFNFEGIANTICHDSQDCPGSTPTCCPVSAKSPYRACVAGSC